MTEIDASLRRLGIDYVDLYQIHRNDARTPLEETLEALHDLVKAGKARYIGASSMRAWEFSKALYLAERHNWTRFVTMQDHYNLLSREEEREMLPLWLDEGAARSSGVPSPGAVSLAGGTRPGARERSAEDGFADMLYTPATERSDRAIVDAVGMIAGERGVSRAQIALAWLRTNPVVVTRVGGPRVRPAISTTLFSSLEIDLTGEEIAQSSNTATRPARTFKASPTTPSSNA